MQISFAQIFPSYRVTAYDTSSAGYYFLGTTNTGGSNIQNNMILDDKGRLVYYSTVHIGDFKLQRNGLISYYFRGKFYLADSSFTIVDSVRCKNGILIDVHDFQILSNGHFLLLGYENVEMDLSSYNLFSHDGSPGSATANVKCGVIQEQDENKNVVFEWHSKDYYAFDDVDTSRLNSPFTVDWEHFNAIEQDTDGNFLLSVRHFNEITKINRSDSSIMWRLGGNRNQFSFTNDPTQFRLQHDIRRIDNGNITLFDNGNSGPPFHPAAAKEYQLDEVNKTATLVWSYVEDSTSYSKSMGSAQRTSNGNTVIDHGVLSNDTITFSVVKPSGEKIFETVFNYTPTSYRAFNYLSLPWQLNRPQINCYENGGQYYLEAGSGFTSYLWSTGETTQTITLNAADTFFVFVPAGEVGFLSSEYLIVDNISSPCSPLASLKEQDEGEATISVFPNPVTDKLIIQSFDLSEESVGVELFDFTGRKILSFETIPFQHSITVPVSHIANGMYLIRINGWSKKFIKQ